MLLKYSQAQKRIKATGIGKPQRTAGGMVKLTSGLMTVVPKIHRRVVKVANKRPATIHRAAVAAVKREQIPVDPCDNSNDSGLGFDHHLDYTHHSSHPTHSGIETNWPGEEPPELKRRRLEIKLESDDANDNFSFQEAVRQQAICVPVRRLGRVAAPLTLNSQLLSTSHDGLIQLLIMCQPEQQHRARYQTEGSRGAVKDRTGNGFPVVKLVGYDRPATLQVFIGTDQGKVAPHMFYQACRVSGKNSTPCVEKKIDGTIVIEVDIEPSKDMVVTCDCVGILKERNVDVEHRFPEEGSGRSKKKSTRCRMVFRTTITHSDGTQETLQVTSQPIVCTQPPGVPEICKKSLSSCGARGGQELFILGKNFLKDTRVIFQEGDSASPAWVQAVQPDKEFLQQSHLVCVVPPYRAVDITEPVTVRLVVESSGKASEPHAFLFLPEGMHASETVSVLAQEGHILDSSVSPQVRFLKGSGAYRGPLLTRRRYRNGGRTGVFSPSLPVAAPLLMPAESTAPFLPTQNFTGKEDKVHPIMMWNKTPDVMMPPPPPGLLPIAMRRSSVQMIVPDPLPPEDLKREVPETVVDTAKPMTDVTELPSTQASSMDAFHRYVSNSSLPSINVGNYLSNIEGNTAYTSKVIKSPVISEMPRIMIPSPTNANKPLFSGDSTNLLTTADTVLANQSAAMSFENRTISANSSVDQSSPENLSVIVNSAMVPKKSSDSLLGQDLQSHKEISGTQNMSSLNILMSPIKRTPSATERLDAFVNSAAESHISPTPTSPIMSSVIDENSSMGTMNEMVMNGTSDLNKISDNNTSPDIQATPLQISPRMSPHQETSRMNEGSLCSLLNSSQTSQQNSSNSAQTIVNMQNNLEQQLNNQNMNNAQSTMSNLMHSPPQVSSNQLQQFPKMASPMDQHLSPHALNSSQISSAEISSIMQATQQNCSNRSMGGFQNSMDHQLSPHGTVNSSQMNDAELNNLIQTSSQGSSSQVQVLTSIQASLEQQLSSQTMNSTQMNHRGMNNPVSLIQSSSCNSPNEVQVMSNLQASLEQLSNQTVTSAQILHTEPIQTNNMGMSSMNSLQSSPHNSSSEVQSLSTIQASLEHRLSSQGINSVQNNHESMTNGGINMSNSVATSQIQVAVAVSQEQALSDLQATIRQHLSSQVLGSSNSELDSNSHSTTRMNSSVETPLNSINQTQNLTNLQMSFGHVTSQVLRSNQQNHDTVTSTSPIPLNSPIQTSPQHHVEVTQSQVFSDLQASYNHHLNSNVVGSTGASQSVTPLERLANTLQTSSEPSSNPTLPRMQSSMNNISSNLTSSPPNHAEALAANSLSINDTQIIDLRSSVPLMTSQSMNVVSNAGPAGSPNMLSPPSSRHSPSSILTSPGISMSSTPTMALSPTNLANTQAMDAGTQSIILGSPQRILTSELSMNNPSTLSLEPGDVRMQDSQSVPIQSNAMNQFDRVTQSLPVQVSSMAQYDQRQELANPNKEAERKDSRVFMIPPGSVINRPQTSEQTVKKCEEGMPLPHELTQMSEHDLISYINPSCFDTV